MEPFTIVTSDDGPAIKKRIENLSEALQNPLRHVRDWIKLELMNLECFILAV